MKDSSPHGRTWESIKDQKTANAVMQVKDSQRQSKTFKTVKGSQKPQKQPSAGKDLTGPEASSKPSKTLKTLKTAKASKTSRNTKNITRFKANRKFC